MILRLVRRSLARQPGRSLLLLGGYALGVAVTVTLLSIGDALVEQSRDRRLVGGGDLAVVPRGLDLETLKTGGVSSLYFRVTQAPFLYRQVLDGPRLEDRIRAAAPWIEDELLYLRTDIPADDPREDARPVSAGGRIPSRSEALGARPELVGGAWSDVDADRRWMAPDDSTLYAELDRFHLPPPEAAGDSTWAEWHYFNLRLPGRRGWLYLTYMVAGDVPDGRWGGRLLATRVDPPGAARTYSVDVPASAVQLSTESPDLSVGDASVRLTGDGLYLLRARIPPEGDPGGAPLTLEATVRPGAGRYLPPVDASPGAFPSGYAVPILRGSAAGRLCEGGACRRFEGATAYHDHNWGTWRGVTWDWGQAQAGAYSLVYGRVIGPDGTGGEPGSPGGFAFLADSLGWLGAFEIDSLGYPPAEAESGDPAAVRLVASRPGDTLRLSARVRHLRASPAGPSPNDAGSGAARQGAERRFLQMEGPARLRGRVLGRRIEATGEGFYETWRGGRAGPGPPRARSGPRADPPEAPVHILKSLPAPRPYEAPTDRVRTPPTTENEEPIR